MNYLCCVLGTCFIDLHFTAEITYNQYVFVEATATYT